MLKTGINVPAKHIMIPFMLLLISIFAAVVFVTLQIVSISNQIAEKQDVLTSYNDISEQLSKGSDILTDNIRLFVATAVPKYMDAYFYELNVAKNREVAIQSLGSLHDDSIASTYIKEALNYSNSLTYLEFHAMHLIAEANNISVAKYPKVAKFILPQNERNLSPAEKNLIALKLVAGPEYIKLKTHINDKIEAAFTKVRKDTKCDQKRLYKKQDKLRMLEFIFTGVFMVGLLAFFFILQQFLIKPLLVAKSYIALTKEVPNLNCFDEIRFLVRTYNAQSKRRTELEGKLWESACTDALTGLPNRMAMNQFTYSEEYTKYKSVVALMFDLNDLKLANDTKGHNAGDELLKKTAQCILQIFGNKDKSNCFRFGGDEYAAYLLDTDEKTVLKLIADFHNLQKEYGISISVGYAQGKCESIESFNELYAKADDAMYAKKFALKKIRGEKAP